MTIYATWLLVGLFGAVSGSARGEALAVSADEPARVFGGGARVCSAMWRNLSDASVTADVRVRLLQASSATTATLGEWPWKKLQVLPGQTVIERVTMEFPDVKAETHFLIKWFEGTNRVFGTTEVLVYPTNLLAELKSLAGEDLALGVFDPDSALKPLLKSVGVKFEDLAESGVAGFGGKLAIVGPFVSRAQMPGDLGERTETLARKGTAVVWLQPPPGPHDKLQPSFRTVRVGNGAVVVVQSQLVANLAESPQAQLHLLHCCRLARDPEPPQPLNSISKP